MRYVGETIEKLRRYIAEKDSRHVLEEVDTLLFVASGRRTMEIGERSGSEGQERKVCRFHRNSPCDHITL